MNELEALAKKEEQEKLQQDQLREQVIGFEQQSVTSDVQQRTAFRDKAIEYQRNYEASLIQDMNAQTQRVEVRQGPPDGDRPLEANAAEESWKEKRSRIKEEKKATAVLKNVLNASSLSATKELRDAARERGIDGRVVSAFSEPLQLDRHGRPATPADEEILRRNQAFAKDYVMGDELARRTRFSEIVNKLLVMEITPHMLEDRNYVLANVQKLKIMSLQLTAMEGVIHDNKAFFDELDPETQQRINEKTDLMGLFGSTFSSACHTCGINSNDGKYWGDSEDNAESRAESLEDYKLQNNAFREACTEWKAKQEYHQQRTREEIARDKAQKLEKYGTYFENGATNFQYDALKETREEIASHPEEYAANRELIDHFYQEFYRTLEASGESAVQGLGYASVALQHRRDTDREGRELYEKADEISEKRGEELKKLAAYSAGLQDVLRATLRGEKLPDAAQKLVADYYEEQRKAHWTKVADDQKAEMQRQQAEEQKLAEEKAQKQAEERAVLGKQLQELQHWDKGEDQDRFRTELFDFQRAFDQAHSVKKEAKRPKAPAEPELKAEPETQKTLRNRDKIAKKSAAQIKEVYDSFRLSIPEDLKQKRPDELHFDARSAWFTDAFHLNKEGQPAEDLDRFIMNRNAQRIRDYASGDAAKRKPILDTAVRQYLNIKLEPDELDDQDRILQDLTYYKKIAQLQIGITTMENENPEYFKKLDPAVREEIQRKKAFLSAFGLNDAVTAIAAMSGVKIDNGSYSDDRDEDEMGEFRKAYLLSKSSLRKASAEYGAETDARKALTRSRVDYEKQDKTLRSSYGVSFPEGASELQYADIQKYRDMIAAHPEEYAANKEAVDAAFREMYKAMTLVGKNTLVMRAYQGISDENGGEQPVRGSEQDLRTRYSNGRAEAYMKEQDLYTHYITGLTGVLEHLLRGKKLNDLGGAVAEHLRQR